MGSEMCIRDSPRELDEKVAEIKLKSMGYEIDTLSDKQKEYLGLD